MATYLIPELLVQLSQIASEGYETVDITELPAEDDCPACLNIEVPDMDDEFIGYDFSIDAYDPLDKNDLRTIQVSSDDLCGEFLFTYGEILTLEQAINTSLEYFKKCTSSRDCPRDIKDNMKLSSIDFRNLQAKLKKFTNKIKKSIR